AQADVEDITGRMRLVLDDIVLAQRQRKLHGVPVVEHARPIREPREHGENAERARTQIVPAVPPIAHGGCGVYAHVRPSGGLAAATRCCVEDRETRACSSGGFAAAILLL